jgi:enoyl-CoA hydratase
MTTSIHTPAAALGVSDLLLDPNALVAGAEPPDLPLGFIDLAAWSADPHPIALPSFPLIGLGDPRHPLAARLDGVIEPPISSESLIRQVTANPGAATVAVELLRSLEGVALDAALTLESLAYGLLQGGGEHARWLAARPTDAPSPPGVVRLERIGDLIRIVLDRPLALNAIDRALRDGLFDAFTVAGLDASVSRIELRASGPAFSVGGDLAEFGVTRDPAIAHQIRSRRLPARPLLARAEILDVHVQGACVGAGLEMAAFAKRLTAAPGAWFQLPELAMGLIPGAGGCVSVPRRIGRQRAALMILSGRRISARTALAWGLIDAIEDRPPIGPDAADLD